MRLLSAPSDRDSLLTGETCYVKLDVQSKTRGNGRVKRVSVNDPGKQRGESDVQG